MLVAASVFAKVGDALSFAFGMFWEILWALMLGFALSAVVQAVVSRGEMQRLLPDDSPRSIARATGLGIVSSSCSYAAVALARSLFSQGCELHRGDGLRVRLDEPGGRVRDHHGPDPRLAVHGRRVRRRPADDRPAGASVSPAAEPAAGGGSPPAGPTGAARPDGRARGDGHVRSGAGLALAAIALPARVHRHRELLRDGLGVGLDRHRRRPADRRRPGRLGPGVDLA